MTRWSAADLARVSAKIRSQIEQPLGASPRQPRKYKNNIVWFQGQKFTSERERDAWKNFELQRITGGIRAVIREVSMTLPGTIRRIRIDFLVIENDLKHRWFDAKGFETAAWRLKRQQVFDSYGLTIELI